MTILKHRYLHVRRAVRQRYCDSTAGVQCQRIENIRRENRDAAGTGIAAIRNIAGRRTGRNRRVIRQRRSKYNRVSAVLSGRRRQYGRRPPVARGARQGIHAIGPASKIAADKRGVRAVRRAGNRVRIRTGLTRIPLINQRTAGAPRRVAEHDHRADTAGIRHTCRRRAARARH